MGHPPAQAIVLAAGRGERLRPWTDTVPKPLLKVGPHRLIEWHLLALAKAGVTDVVINTAWLEDQFPAVLGDGSRYGLRLHWSFEQRDFGAALETGGGIARALPMLDQHFWVVSADVFVPGFNFAQADCAAFAASGELARLWLAPNATHHPDGDFAITAQGLATRDTEPRLTWSSLGLFSQDCFAGVQPGERLALRPLLDHAATAGRLGALALQTPWVDVGTVERWKFARDLVLANGDRAA